MAKKEDKRTRSDIIAERRGVPGRDRQVPTDTTGIYMGGRHIDNVDMNFRGLMGGLPTTSARELRKTAAFARDTGATDSAKAAETRARNIEGHNKMTDKAMADIKRRKLQADAKAPGASLYAKGRAKLNEVTGFKKGGSVSSASKRADGCATKGKTRGKMV